MSVETDDTDDEQQQLALDPLSQLEEDLRNIRSVILVTRENIDALNAKFADFQQPPALYLEEYQELTSKLHDLETKEQDLGERRSQMRAAQQQQQSAERESTSEPSEPPDPAEERVEVSVTVGRGSVFVVGGFGQCKGVAIAGCAFSRNAQMFEFGRNCIACGSIYMSFLQS